MSDSLTDELNACVSDAFKSSDLNESMQHLARAFQIFSDESKKMKGESRELKREITVLRKRLSDKQNELMITSSYLTQLLKNTSEGIVYVNMEGKLISLNRSAEKLLDIDSKRLLLRQFWNHFPDDYFGFSMRDALNFGLKQSLSYISTSKRREIEVRTHLLLEGPKEYQGVLLFLNDLTDIQELTEVANRNERLKELGQMTSSVAHEIKNPLGGIRGYAMLLESDLDDPTHKEMASSIKEGTKTLDRLLSKILSYARPVQMKAVSRDLAPFMRSLLKFIKVDPATPKNVKIDMHISDEPLMAPVDTELLRQAFLNLIMNAFQAMESGGKLMISLMKRSNSCLITISDTGCGIEEEDAKKVFSPFFTTKEKGHGIGLTETHKIIKAHFGEIDIRSEKGRGTTFTITLPLKR